MIAREKFVGTITSGYGDEELLLLKFLGEGAEGVVYGVAPAARPSDRGDFLKLSKPQAFLEMDVLHYSFRIDKKLYPRHPLLMSPDQRLKLLANEMIERIRSPRCEFRVATFRNIMEVAIRGLTYTYGKVFAKGQMRPEILLEDPSVAPRIDENLLYRIRELLDEDNVIEEHVPFLEYLADAVEGLIVSLKQMGRYYPFSTNVLYNLVGLKLADFINESELDYIASDPRLVQDITHESLRNLWQFGTILYHRAGDLIARIAKKQFPRRSESGLAGKLSSIEQEIELKVEETEIRSHTDGALAAFMLVYKFASRPQWDSSTLRGLSMLWYANILGYMQGAEKGRRLALETAVTELSKPADSRDRHDALMALSQIINDDEPEAASDYRRQARDIEKDLERQLKSGPAVI